jgi:phosphohistidine phosphatase SixA
MLPYSSWRSALLLAAAGVLGAATAQAQTVILVRHAERAMQPGNDPGLSPAGQARAGALTEALRDARLTRVVSSSFQRTRQTAGPAAKAAKVEVEVLPIAGDAKTHVAATVDLIKTLPRNGVVLVVGHSNTVPLIAAALGVRTAVTIRECEFDRMMVISLGKTPPIAVLSRYGAPAADCPK